MKKRESRRNRDWQYAKRTQQIHGQIVHRGQEVDCVCERSVWFFKKRRALGCDCRRHKAGAPKIGTGTCNDPTSYRPAVIERIEGRAIVRNWAREYQ